MIDKVLNKAEAVELFEKEAILFGTSDVIPFYRIIELFGEEAAVFFSENIKWEGYLKGGEDWNAWGACTDESPMTNYLYRAGFLKLVTEHNYQLVIRAHSESEGGRIFDKYWEERNRRIEEQDAEEERKRAERRAKRAAAKTARKEAEKGRGVTNHEKLETGDAVADVVGCF